MYALLLETYIRDPEEKAHLFRAVQDDTKFPAIKRKADWCMRWMGSDLSFAERLVRGGTVGSPIPPPLHGCTADRRFPVPHLHGCTADP